MHHITNHITETTSVLARLRALLPNRQLQVSDALRLAELQANRLLELRHPGGAPIASDIVIGLPGIAVDYDLDMPASGASDWDATHRAWVITLCASEPDTRHRFTMLHEYHHIVMHGSRGIAEANSIGKPAAEAVADYFAACVLMPKRLVKAAYFGGVQTVSDLAEQFDVSEAAMQVRLRQLGLSRSSDSHAAVSTGRQTPSSIARHHRYLRALSPTWSVPTALEVTQ